jgi:hypothetical protein
MPIFGSARRTPFKVREFKIDPTPEEIEDERSFLELYGNDVPRLKQYAIEHFQFKIEQTKDRAMKNQISMHAAFKKIGLCDRQIARIDQIDSGNIDEITLDWLRERAVGHRRELGDLKNGTPYTPPQPDSLEVVERIRQYTGPNE